RRHRSDDLNAGQDVRDFDDRRSEAGGARDRGERELADLVGERLDLLERVLRGRADQRVLALDLVAPEVRDRAVDEVGAALKGRRGAAVRERLFQGKLGPWDRGVDRDLTVCAACGEEGEQDGNESRCLHETLPETADRQLGAGRVGATGPESKGSLGRTCPGALRAVGKPAARPQTESRRLSRIITSTRHRSEIPASTPNEI